MDDNLVSLPNLTTDPPPANASSVAVPGSPTSRPASQTTSMEQSVKLFKVFEALRNGDTAALQTLTTTADGADVSLPGTTILHVTVQAADLPIVESVLKTATEKELNAKDKDGNTPLHIAASLGRAHLVKTLLEHPDIDDTVANHHGKTALDVARTPDVFQHLQLARSMWHESKVQEIHTLVAADAYEDLENLVADHRVRAIIDVNSPQLATDPATTESGGGLLHEAARKKDVKLIQMLLLNGADPFFRDRKGKLPQDVTKDDRTRAILKKSPAAAAAQRGIQEKSILGSNASLNSTSPSDSAVGSKEAREMKGYLKKWTNYTSGYKLRWFVLEDGVLSYYKHQDDAGSACRGAINMRIARLHMDPKEKLSFEILGKSSVKYHLKANHQVEAKRWFWALNNAIQWSKDEARQEARKSGQVAESARRHSRVDQIDRTETNNSIGPSTLTPDGHAAASNHRSGSSATLAGDVDADGSVYEPSVIGDELAQTQSHTGHQFDGDIDDDEDLYDDASGHDPQPASKDAFNVAAQSARMQLDLLAHVSAALASERAQQPDLRISDPSVESVLTSYDTAVRNLRGLMGDLQRISRDHDAYWQHRLEREANVRRLWEDSMARVAKEQEDLQKNLGESEEKRKRTKRALRDVLDSQDPSSAISRSRAATFEHDLNESVANTKLDTQEPGTPRSKKTFHDHDISDDESDMDDEFFDAVDAGEVVVKDALPVTPAITQPAGESSRALEIAKSYRGYEDGVRERLKLDADNRPKVSLWVSMFSCV